MKITIKVIEQLHNKFKVFREVRTYDIVSRMNIYEGEYQVNHWQYEGYENEDVMFNSEQAAIDFATKYHRGELTLRYPRTVLELTNTEVK